MAAEVPGRPHRDTEPRILLRDVDFGTPRSRRVIRRGTIIHAAPGSEIEAQYGGPANLGPLTGMHHGGASN